MQYGVGQMLQIDLFICVTWECIIRGSGIMHNYVPPIPGGLFWFSVGVGMRCGDVEPIVSMSNVFVQGLINKYLTKMFEKVFIFLH